MSIELNKPEYTVDCTVVDFFRVGWYVSRKEYVKSVFGFVREKTTKVYRPNLRSGYKECEAVAKALREYNK